MTVATYIHDETTPWQNGGTGYASTKVRLANKEYDLKSDFGATGDGVTDDSAAIQAALTALAGGGNLLVPPGTYLYNNVVWSGAAGARLVMEGVGNAIFQRTGASPMVFSGSVSPGTGLTSGVSIIALDNVTIDLSESALGQTTRVLRLTLASPVTVTKGQPIRVTSLNAISGTRRQEWTLTLSTPGSSCTLTVDGQTSASLSDADGTAGITTKLEALSTVGAGRVTVTGSAGVYTVYFDYTLHPTRAYVVSWTVAGGGAVTYAKGYNRYAETFFASVAATNSTTVYLDRLMRAEDAIDLDLDPRLYLYNDTTVHVNNCQWDVTDAIYTGADVGANVRFQYLSGGEVTNCRVRRSSARGMQMMACIRMHVSGYRAFNCRNKAAIGAYGYGLEIQTGDYINVVDCHFTNCRHGFDTTGAQYRTPSEMGHTGRSADITVTGCTATFCSNSGFSTHEDGYNVAFVNCATRGLYAGDNSAGPGFIARGMYIGFYGCRDFASRYSLSAFVSKGLVISDCTFMAPTRYGVVIRDPGANAGAEFAGDEGTSRISEDITLHNVHIEMEKNWDASTNALVIQHGGASGGERITNVHLRHVTVRNNTAPNTGITSFVLAFLDGVTGSVRDCEFDVGAANVTTVRALSVRYANLDISETRFVAQQGSGSNGISTLVLDGASRVAARDLEFEVTGSTTASLSLIRYLDNDSVLTGENFLLSGGGATIAAFIRALGSPATAVGRVEGWRGDHGLTTFLTQNMGAVSYSYRWDNGASDAAWSDSAGSDITLSNTGRMSPTLHCLCTPSGADRTISVANGSFPGQALTVTNGSGGTYKLTFVNGGNLTIIADQLVKGKEALALVWDGSAWRRTVPYNLNVGKIVSGSELGVANAQATLVGSNNALLISNNATPNTAHDVRTASLHYDGVSGVTMDYASNGVSTNRLLHGGGTSVNYAVTAHEFYTAPNNVTLTGTKRWSIEPTGELLPAATNTYALGSASLEMSNIYSRTLTISVNATIGGTLGVTGAATLGTVAAGALTATKLTTSGGLVLNDRSVTTTYTVTTSDCILRCSTSGGSFTATLPDATTCAGQVFIFKKTSSANTLTIGTTASQTIDGSASKTVTNLNTAVILYSNGSNWQIIGAYTTALTL